MKRAQGLEDAAPPLGVAELAASAAMGRLSSSRGGGEPAVEAAGEEERRCVCWRGRRRKSESVLGVEIGKKRRGYKKREHSKSLSRFSTPASCFCPRLLLSLEGGKKAKRSPLTTYPRWTSSHVPLQLQGAMSLIVKVSPHQQMRHIRLLRSSSSAAAAAAVAGCSLGGCSGEGVRAGATAAAGRGMVSKGEKKSEE